MTVRRLGLAALVLGVMAPALAAAQGLGDTATREREKRAKQAARTAAPARVFTDEDLTEGRPPGQAAAGGTSATARAPAPAPDASTEDGPPPLEDPQAAVRPYIENLRRAQAQVEAVEARIRELSGKLNPMSTTFIYGASGSNSANEEAEVRQQLQEAEGQLREARSGLAAANQAMEDARRGRAPLIPNPVAAGPPLGRHPDRRGQGVAPPDAAGDPGLPGLVGRRRRRTPTRPGGALGLRATSPS